LVVKEVSINIANREELEVNRLSLLFSVSGAFIYDGTTINPDVPLGISKMFCSIFICLFHFFFF
jgi:hypothetical protein